MKRKKENIISKLKHNKLNIDAKLLAYYLWYSETREAYIQRNCIYDDTFVDSDNSNIYIALELTRIFKLEELRCFKDASSCEEIVLENKKDNVLLITKSVKNKKNLSLYMNIIEKIRNAFAHGTFNYINNTIIMVNQKYPNENSIINFYLSTNIDYKTLDSKLKKLLKDINILDVKKKIKIINNVLNFKIKDEKLIDEKNGVEISFIEIKPKGKTKKEQIKQQLIDLSNEEKENKIYITDQDLGKVSLKNRTSKSGKTMILKPIELLEKYKVTRISL